MDRLLSARLVGREDERRELLAAVDAAPRSGPLVLVGEAGIGKSRLLREAGQRARERGVPLMWGRATAGAGPYAPVQEAVAAGVRALGAPERRELLTVRTVLAQLAGEWTGHAVADPSPLAVAEALLRFFAVTARAGGAVVVLEDLHWSERETLTVARYLLDNVDAHGALCLLSLRPDPGDALAMVRRLADTRAARLLDLGPLADPEVDELVLACLGADAAPGALLDFVRAHADGVPFVVEELLAGLARTGGLLRDDGGWHLVGHRMRTTVPATVAESVDRRLATLHPRTRQVLRAAALLGRIDTALLGRITGLDEETVFAALREAGYAQLLDVGGSEVRFRHALTRDRVAALLLPPERVALAARAAAAVRDAHPDLPGPWCELVASLAEQAGDTVAAAHHLREAGRRAQARGALDTATVRLERALELAAAAEPEAAAAAAASAARTVLAQVRALAGDVEGALRLAPPRANLPDGSAEDAELQLALVRALVTAGRLTEARARISGALHGPDARPAGDRLRALVLAAEVDVADGDTESARRLAGAALARAGDDVPEGRCCSGCSARAGVAQCPVPSAQCSTSLAPMNARMIDNLVDRYTSLSSSPVTKKNSARRPSSATALAVNTMWGSAVTPNTTGI